MLEEFNGKVDNNVVGEDIRESILSGLDKLRGKLEKNDDDDESCDDRNPCWHCLIL